MEQIIFVLVIVSVILYFFWGQISSILLSLFVRKSYRVEGEILEIKGGEMFLESSLVIGFKISTDMDPILVDCCRVTIRDNKGIKKTVDLTHSMFESVNKKFLEGKSHIYIEYKRYGLKPFFSDLHIVDLRVT